VLSVDNLFGCCSSPAESSSSLEATFAFEPTGPGHVLESLARSIGPIPLVLLPDTALDDAGVPFVKPSSNEMPSASERGDRYQLFGEIARGGMGAVLKGRDPDLVRDLAVKVVHVLSPASAHSQSAGGDDRTRARAVEPPEVLLCIVLTWAARHRAGLREGRNGCTMGTQAKR
jgi:hypothetical protein